MRANSSRAAAARFAVSCGILHTRRSGRASRRTHIYVAARGCWLESERALVWTSSVSEPLSYSCPIEATGHAARPLRAIDWLGHQPWISPLLGEISGFGSPGFR